MRTCETRIFLRRPPWTTAEEVASSATEESEPPAPATSGTPLLPLLFRQPWATGEKLGGCFFSVYDLAFVLWF